jgi:hypothetical protein
MGRLGDEIARELARALGVPLKDIHLPHGGGGGAGGHAHHHKPAPGRDHHAHHPAHHHHGGDNPGGKVSAPNITVNLNGSKGKLSHEEVAGISHEIAKQLALA